MRRKADYPRQASDLKLAPGDLGLVQAFVNTADLEHGTDELDSPAALAGWLADRGLLSAETELRREDLERILEAREALRALLAANGGRPAAAEVLDRLDRLAATAPAVVRFPRDGKTRFEAGAKGVDGALGRLFAAVAVAMARVEGLWPRLKVCAAPGCRAVFFDGSKNLAGKWCSQRRCGNRAASRKSQRSRRRDAARRHKAMMRRLRNLAPPAEPEGDS